MKLPPLREALFELIKKTPALDWLILTKRPENIASMLPSDWGNGWDNVWLGATAENQAMYDLRIETLLRVPAKIHFLSVEPLLTPLSIRHGRKDGLNWIIVGGESGDEPRPMDLAWARTIRDDCARLGVTYFFKQQSENNPIGDSEKLDGVLYHKWPPVRPVGRPRGRRLQLDLNTQCLQDGQDFPQLAGGLPFFQVDDKPETRARGQRQIPLRDAYLLARCLDQFANLLRGVFHKVTVREYCISILPKSN